MSQFKAVLILWSANDLDKVELFSSPSTAYCVGQFGVNQLVKFVRFQSGQNHLVTTRSS